MGNRMQPLLSRRSVLGLFGAAAMSSDLFALQAEHLTLRTADDRDSSVTVWRARGTHRGTILFSHGAMSAPTQYDGLILPWVIAGYDVWAPLHVDSSLHPDTKRYQGFATWHARIEDMRALAKQVRVRQYVAAGHSYGALVALTLGGATAVSPEGVEGSLRDSRVKASMAFSPPQPIPKLIDAAGYATLAVPALIQTGDHDVPPGSTAEESWRQHLVAYDASAAGGHRYSLVLAGVDHYFGGLICSQDYPGADQSAQLRTAAELSTLFLDAYAAGKRSRRRALDQRLSDTGPTQLRVK